MSSTNILIDVLIPCYNGEKTILKCIESVLKQSYKNVLITVVNDGSTDKTKEIIEDLASKHNNIKIINQENKGLAKTRNVLINSTKNEYFYFLDADDWLEDGCLEDFISNLDDNDVVLNSCLIKRKNKKIKPFYITTNKIKQQTTILEYLENNSVFAWNILIKRSFYYDNNFKFYDETSFFEDCGLMTYLLYKSKKAKILNNPKYVYYINENSLSHSSLISQYKIESAICQLTNLYDLFKSENMKDIPSWLNSQLAVYHCIIFTYIQFQSKLDKQTKKQLKGRLISLEKNNWKLKLPKRQWKCWYYLLYRLFGY